MLEMHLKQPTFTYRACGLFAKSKEIINKIKETRDSRYIYQNELDKANFQHDMASGDFKDLNRRITTILTNPSFLLKFSTTRFRHVSAYYQVMFNTDEQFLFYNFIMILKEIN